MGKKNKFNPRKKQDYQRKRGNRPDLSRKREKYIVLSFRYFDRSQGQNFKEWEENEILSTATEKLSSLCQMTVSQATHQQIVKVYTKVEFPPKSKFTYPKQVPDGVNWGSMHIQGKECVVGFFEDNVFNIVFLDMNHEFWPSKK